MNLAVVDCSLCIVVNTCINYSFYIYVRVLCYYSKIVSLWCWGLLDNPKVRYFEGHSPGLVIGEDHYRLHCPIPPLDTPLLRSAENLAFITIRSL